jgi:hypothetical protein
LKKKQESTKGAVKKKKKEKKKAAAVATAHVTGGTMEEGEKGQKVPKDLLHIECFKCKQPGHYSTSKECPLHPENKKNKAKAGFINNTWADADMCIFTMMQAENDLEEHMINNAVHVTQGLLPTEVLLDNQANISIMHPMLLTNVRAAPKKIRVKDVRGPQLIVDKVRELQGFFEVYACEYTKANILSFADVEDLYSITYDRGQAFTVHRGDGDVKFKWREKLYVADWIGKYDTYATVHKNALVYTKEELRRAREVYELVENSGYPSPNEALHLLTDGNIRGLPALIAADLERAFKVYRMHPEYVRGPLTKK